MPDLEFLVWRRRFSPVLRRLFKQPAVVKQPDLGVPKLSRAVEVGPG